jgi:hypothetical protein
MELSTRPTCKVIGSQPGPDQAGSGDAQASVRCRVGEKIDQLPPPRAASPLARIINKNTGIPRFLTFLKCHLLSNISGRSPSSLDLHLSRDLAELGEICSSEEVSSKSLNILTISPA